MYTFTITRHNDQRPSDLFEYAMYDIYQGKKCIGTAKLKGFGIEIEIRLKRWCDSQTREAILADWDKGTERIGTLTRETDYRHFIDNGGNTIQSFYRYPSFQTGRR